MLSNAPRVVEGVGSVKVVTGPPLMEQGASLSYYWGEEFMGHWHWHWQRLEPTLPHAAHLRYLRLNGRFKITCFAYFGPWLICYPRCSSLFIIDLRKTSPVLSSSHRKNSSPQLPLLPLLALANLLTLCAYRSRLAIIAQLSSFKLLFHEKAKPSLIA